VENQTRVSGTLSPMVAATPERAPSTPVDDAEP